jgi:hypothetical protein
MTSRAADSCSLPMLGAIPSRGKMPALLQGALFGQSHWGSGTFVHSPSTVVISEVNP